MYVESREEDETADDEDAESAMPAAGRGRGAHAARASIPSSTSRSRRRASPRPRSSRSLEELGIGRPSTYASILGTIINDRGYVRRERRTLFATELGIEVTDLLLPFFQDIMNVEFTAQMED